MHAYMSLRNLPAHERPCMVVRSHGCIHVAVHPGATWSEIVAWSIGHLTAEERDLYRPHFGCGPVGTRIPDEAWARALTVVPDALMTVAERRRAAARLLEQLTA